MASKEAKVDFCIMENEEYKNVRCFEISTLVLTYLEYTCILHPLTVAFFATRESHFNDGFTVHVRSHEHIPTRVRNEEKVVDSITGSITPHGDSLWQLARLLNTQNVDCINLISEYLMPVSMRSRTVAVWNSTYRSTKKPSSFHYRNSCWKRFGTH